MQVDEYSLKEIEYLSCYDLMGYIDVPFFNIGGLTFIDRLAELCRISEDLNISVVVVEPMATPPISPKPAAAKLLELTLQKI